MFGFFQKNKMQKMADEMGQTMFREYQGRKLALYESAEKLIQVSVPEEDRRGKIAGLVSTLLTLKPHPHDKLATISASDQDLARGVADELLTDPEAATIAADADWWLAQLRITQAYDQRSGQVNLALLETGIDYVQAAIQIGGSRARYLATLAQAFLTAQRPEEAYDAACGAVDATDDDAERMMPESLRLKGNSAYSLDHYQEAEDAYVEALRRNPSIIGVHEALQLLRKDRHRLGL
jgi:tetratricopeptide (TPR) repeat protein